MTKINGICEALADYQKMVQNSIIGLGSKIIRKTYAYSIICKIATFFPETIFFMLSKLCIFVCCDFGIIQ